MALPWLIGGVVLAIGAAIASSDDDERECERDWERDWERERERERERAEDERKKQKEAARENFAIGGERIGADIEQSLRGWIEVKHDKSPSFSATLSSRGYKIKNESPTTDSLAGLVTAKGRFFDAVRENLKIYSDVYAVTLNRGSELTEAQEQLEKIDAELLQVKQLKAEISRIKATQGGKSGEMQESIEQVGVDLHQIGELKEQIARLKEKASTLNE